MHKYVDPGTIYDGNDPEMAALVRKQRIALGKLTECNFLICQLEKVPQDLEDKYKQLVAEYHEITDEAHQLSLKRKQDENQSGSDKSKGTSA